MVMGILSLADSAHNKKSKQSVTEYALERAEQLLEQGATIIDVSRETSNITAQQELEILLPVIEVLAKRISVPISIDTSNTDVMIAAVSAGAKILNDIRAFTKPGSIATACRSGAMVSLMHMQYDPTIRRVESNAQDIVSEVYQYLEQRIAAFVEEGMPKNKIIIDPGFGFGKNLAQNLLLLRSLDVFKNLQCLIMVDISHKSMIGQIIEAPADRRVYGSIAAEVIAISRGADIIRSHDVQATADAIKVVRAVASM